MKHVAVSYNQVRSSLFISANDSTLGGIGKFYSRRLAPINILSSVRSFDYCIAQRVNTSTADFLYSLGLEHITDRRENPSTGLSTKLVDREKLMSGTMVEQASNHLGDTRACNSPMVQGNDHNTVFS